MFVDGQIAEFVEDKSDGARYFLSSTLSRLAAWAAASVLMASMAVVKSTDLPARQAV